MQIKTELMADTAENIEFWQAIVGYEDYSISTAGRVRNEKKNKELRQSTYSCGYYAVYLHGKQFGVARLIAQAFIPNPDNLAEVDHINRNKTDNRVDNLRWASRGQQGANRDKFKEGGYKGVSLHKRNNKWIAKIRVNNKHYNLGSYENEHEAALIYNWFALKLHKEFAKINEGVPGYYTQELSLKIIELCDRHGF
jgi:HNH endonuclease/NUMOD4 motif/AP2 domain